MPPRVAPRLIVRAKELEQSHICLGTTSYPQKHDDRYVSYILNTLLGGSMSSRLFQEVREKRGLAYSVGSYAVGYADTGQVGVYLGTREDNLATACGVIAAELRRLAEDPVPADELRRAKDHLKGRLVLSLESSGTRMNRIGKALLTRTELLSIDEVIERVEAVEAEDVQALAAEHWVPERMSAAAIGPSGEAVRAGLERLSPELVGGG
jgi:predicted Zn-dependent peptidase